MMSERGHAKSLKDPYFKPTSKVSSRQLWLAGATAFILTATSLGFTPFAKAFVAEIPAFLPMYGLAMVIISFLLSTLLLIKGSIEEQGDTIRLGGAYLFVALMMMAYIASFPGAFAPGRLIGVPESTAWIWVLCHIGFALMVLHYAWVARLSVPRKASLFVTVAVDASLALGAAALATRWVNLLPPILFAGNVFAKDVTQPLLHVMFWLALAALASVVCLRIRTTEQLWLAIALLAALLDIWLNWICGSRYTIGWYAAKAAWFLTSLTVLISKVHEITQLYSTAAHNNKLLQALVHKDGLTGLSNRRRFDELLELEFRRARRQSLPLGLILIDVDWFKSYNDAYGHLAGDECLRAIGTAISSVLQRAGDEVARYGGEEIVVILPVTDQKGTIMLAEKMRAAVARLNIEHRDSAYGMVTISVGTSMLISFDGGVSPDDLVGAADKALYKAKGLGRNKVCSTPLYEKTNIALDAA
jgi:diguanylate cyclase (GGDEF)-like protein